MDNIYLILACVIPSLIVGGVAYLLINKFLEAQNKKHLIQVKKDSVKITIPIRLQAYERLILLLERVDPVQIVNRSIKPGMTIKQLHMEIIRTMKEEFDHNVTQQIYVSSKLWTEIQKAKDEGLKLVSLVMSQSKIEDSAIDFSKKLIQIQAEQELYTNRKAIEELKAEIKKLF